MKHLILTLLFAFPLFATLTNAQESNKEWVFVEKDGRKEKRLKQGQNIQVVWQGLSKQITSKGKLRAITAGSLILEIKGSNASIAQNDIVEIRVKRKPNALEWILGIGLILVTLVYVVSGIALIMLYGTGEATGGEALRIILPYLLLGFLGVLLILPNKKTIHHPFSENWSLQEIPTKPNNMP